MNKIFPFCDFLSQKLTMTMRDEVSIVVQRETKQITRNVFEF